MIQSKKLEKCFKKYDPDWLHHFLIDIFGIAYCKTYSDCGLYVWLGVRPPNFHDDPSMDRDFLSCHVRQPHFPNLDGRGMMIYIFIHLTEGEIIHKFTKYQKLKAFL